MSGWETSSRDLVLYTLLLDDFGLDYADSTGLDFSQVTAAGFSGRCFMAKVGLNSIGSCGIFNGAQDPQSLSIPDFGR